MMKFFTKIIILVNDIRVQRRCLILASPPTPSERLLPVTIIVDISIHLWKVTIHCTHILILIYVCMVQSRRVIGLRIDDVLEKDFVFALEITIFDIPLYCNFYLIIVRFPDQ